MEPDLDPAVPDLDRAPWAAFLLLLAVLVVAGVSLALIGTDQPWPGPALSAASGHKKSGSPGGLPADGGSDGSAGGLGKLLLPRPAGYVTRSDAGSSQVGTGLNSAQALARIVTLFGPLPTADRRAAEKDLAGLPLRGVGTRSFRSVTDDRVVRIQLQQADQRVARSSVQIMVGLLNGIGLLAKGPNVPAHPEAHCYVSSLDSHAARRAMTCVAAEGGLMVSFDASGSGPVSGRDVVGVLADQLDRIAPPGASV